MIRERLGSGGTVRPGNSDPSVVRETSTGAGDPPLPGRTHRPLISQGGPLDRGTERGSRSPWEVLGPDLGGGDQDRVHVNPPPPPSLWTLCGQR